jgi:hypothetical protein
MRLAIFLKTNDGGGSFFTGPVGLAYSWSREAKCLALGHRELLRVPATPRSSTNQQPGHACIFNLYIGNSRCYEELRAKIPARSRSAPARDVLHYAKIGNVAAKGLLMAIIYQKCG